MEYTNKEQILINLKPELVEKKEPPIITKIRKIKEKFCCLVLKANPILDILLETDSKFL